METKFTEQQSLDIINKMIQQAQNNLQKGSGNSMIFWGLLVAFTAILNLILALVLENPNQSFWVWSLMIPGFIVNYFNERAVDRKAMTKTHIDRIITHTWAGFGVVAFLLEIIIFGFALKLNDSRLFLLITPIVMLMCGMAEFITAKACRFKPFLYGAIVMWIGSLSCLLVKFLFNEDVGMQFIILAVCMIVGFVMPGYLLNKKAKENV